MSGLKENIDAVNVVVWEGSTFTIDSLLKEEYLCHLSLETISKILLEFMLFILHICDREIFSIFGPKKRIIIMDQVLVNVHENLGKYDELILHKNFGEVTQTSLGKYFNYLFKMAPSADFQNNYNDRQIEYASYKELLPKDGEPLKNALVWEFSKKTAALVDDKPNPAIIMRFCLLASDLIVACKKTLKTTLRESEDNAN